MLIRKVKDRTVKFYKYNYEAVNGDVLNKNDNIGREIIIEWILATKIRRSRVKIIQGRTRIQQ